MSEGATKFRREVNRMRSWKPRDIPSNRDRMELYAFHRQAIHGDAPKTTGSHMTELPIAEKTKLQAWQSKRGISKTDAMNYYMIECNRQTQLYGTASTSISSSPALNTPRNTPATNPQASEDSALCLSPRGLAAIPLLAAAAGESRLAYLNRLRVTPPTNGWWSRQETLTAEPGSVLSTPEATLLAVASRCESLSLRTGYVPSTIRQSFLWPFHNVMLSIWIVIIFVATLVESTYLIIKTLIPGSRNTGDNLPSIFEEEIFAASRLVTSLCQPHQAMTIRLAGLVLMPLGTLYDVVRVIVNRSGYLPAALLYIFANFITWWYWICIIPWIVMMGLGMSVAAGVCFALIEIAGSE